MGGKRVIPCELEFERIKEYLRYDNKSGQIFWRKNYKRNKAGTIAGIFSKARKQWEVRLGRRHFIGHQIAWYFIHGTWPKKRINHLNKDKCDNRPQNLCDKHAVANANRDRFRKNPMYCIRNRYRKFYVICYDNKKKYKVGSFLTMEDAKKARDHFFAIRGVLINNNSIIGPLLS